MTSHNVESKGLSDNAAEDATLENLGYQPGMLSTEAQLRFGYC
jgi:hypothetical protein